MQESVHDRPNDKAVERPANDHDWMVHRASQPMRRRADTRSVPVLCSAARSSATAARLSEEPSARAQLRRSYSGPSGGLESPCEVCSSDEPAWQGGPNPPKMTSASRHASAALALVSPWSVWNWARVVPCF